MLSHQNHIFLINEKMKKKKTKITKMSHCLTYYGLNFPTLL